ncbi:outer membrane beta-barrel protein [Arcicella rosea]|uniref:Outer membrane protein beta-barrel domain-containing protein n=1 Tax=Arcicella rosea TaxID=502909 RepID=A0A841EL18_9BACT|nr:outer membrane beta-barrel protein [Arcicella rosea]MBB6002884.1 hypothetical protein [Arcicella rosea]
MKNNSIKVVIAMYVLSFGFNTNAQSTNQEEPIFGTVLSKKSTSDSTKKPFNLFKPAFLRLGIIGGSMISFDGGRGSNGGMLGLRVEYGISNRFSVVGQFQNNRSRNDDFPDAQASLGLNWMPFKSKRLQPYVGLGVGIGGDGLRRNDFRNSGRRFDYDNLNERRHAEGFGLLKTGLNYVLAKRLIGTIEANYEMPFQNKDSNGNANIALGLSYQFGRNKK